MQGCLDKVGSRTVHGWAVGRDGGPTQIKIYVNEELIRTLVAQDERPDLVPHFKRADLGFNADIGRVLKAGDVVDIRLPGSGTWLRQAEKSLVGSPYTVRHREADRDDKALTHIDKSMKILEFGPAWCPIAPRADGWNSYVFDYASEAELRSRHAQNPDVDRIEAVDFIWSQGPIHDAIPAEQHGTFDAIIASHVIEHFPDPIAFYKSAAMLLKDGGLISLVVPDKRFTFDFFRPLTLTSDLLYAHYHERIRHTKRTGFESIAYSVNRDGDATWGYSQLDTLNFVHREDALGDAKRLFDALSESGDSPYFDMHHTVFTPSSFHLIIFELFSMGVIAFDVLAEQPPSPPNIWITLKKTPPRTLPTAEVTAKRLRLLKATLREQAEQVSLLPD